MTPEDVMKWAREADEYAGHICSEGDPTPSVKQFRTVRDTHFARLARAAAFKEAAKECDELGELSRESPTDSLWQWGECASRLRALAAREKEDQP